MDSIEGDSSDSTLVFWTHGYFDFTTEHICEVGSALRGTRELMCSRVDLEGTHEISTWHGSAFKALAVSP